MTGQSGSARPMTFRRDDKMDAFANLADFTAIERVPLDERIPFRSVYEMFRARAAELGDHPAVIWLPNGRSTDTGQTISYAELFANITRAANLFHAHGVGPDDAVSLLLPNSPEVYYAMWGASAAGIANPINPLLAPAQIADILAAAGSRFLVVGGPDMAYDVFDKAVAVREIYSDLDTIFVLGDAADDMCDFVAGMAAQPADRLVSGRDIHPDDPSVYFHTGGTTGAPKLAQQTQRNQLFMAWTCTFALGIIPQDIIFTGLPLFHVNAAIATGLGGFFGGGTSLLCGQIGFRDKGMVADFWTIVRRWRATLFSGVPTIYAALLDNLSPDMDVSSLRFGMCGAAPMPVSLFRDFEERTGVRILELYGMTEGCAVSTANPRDGERRIGSIGLRLPYQNVRVAVLGDNGEYVRDAEVDEVGALLLGGPNLFPGYKQERFNTNIWPLPGWFNSGDLGRRDAQGYHWLAGRAKDLIIRSGHNIDPAAIEEALHRHPAVELAAAIGKPDAYAGEVPIAYVVLAAGAAANSDDLRAFARDNVHERPAAPVEVVIIERMPVTAVGKIFKPALRLDAVRRAFSAAVADFAGVKIETRVDDRRGIIAEVCCPDETARPEVEARLHKFSTPFVFV